MVFLMYQKFCLKNFDKNNIKKFIRTKNKNIFLFRSKNKKDTYYAYPASSSIVLSMRFASLSWMSKTYKALSKENKKIIPNVYLIFIDTNKGEDNKGIIYNRKILK